MTEQMLIKRMGKVAKLDKSKLMHQSRSSASSQYVHFHTELIHITEKEIVLMSICRHSIY